jgi:hypothetical protein
LPRGAASLVIVVSLIAAMIQERDARGIGRGQQAG